MLIIKQMKTDTEASHLLPRSCWSRAARALRDKTVVGGWQETAAVSVEFASCDPAQRPINRIKQSVAGRILNVKACDLADIC